MTIDPELLPKHFPPDSLCIGLPEIPTIDKICLPGGICLDYVWDSIDKIPHMADIALDFFSQIGPAMTPLRPFFNLLDVGLALFRCVQAIPNAIVKLDPSELLQCAPALAKAVDQLLKLIPQLSIPKMVKAILKNLAALIRAIGSDLYYIKAQGQRIADMVDRAAEWQDHKLNGFLVCAQSNLDTTVMSTAEALRGIGSIVLLVNVFMGLIGGPEVPCFGDIMSNLGDGIDTIIALLMALAEVLETIADAIPDPDLVLTLALGDLRC